MVGRLLPKSYRDTVGFAPDRSINGACTVRLKGLLTKSKPATSGGRAKIPQGDKHRFVVTVNPKAVGVVKKQGKLLVKEWVRIDTIRVVVYKQLKVVAK